jgi:trigger factor
MAPGDERSLMHTFPEDSDFESLRDVTAEFKVTMEEVKARTLPELSDEFAQSVGDYGTLEGLRSDIRASLEQQNKKDYDDEYDDRLLNEVIEQSTIEYPPQMLDEEIDEVLHQLQHRLEAQNLDLNTYLLTRKMNEDELRAEVKPVAEKRLKRSLVLLQISKEEHIDIAADEIQAETVRALDVLTKTMSEKDLRKLSTEQLVPSLVSNIMVDMRISKTLEQLRSIAKGEAEVSEEASGEGTRAEADSQEISKEATVEESLTQPTAEPDAPVSPVEVEEEETEQSSQAEAQPVSEQAAEESAEPTEDESEVAESMNASRAPQSEKEG